MWGTCMDTKVMNMCASILTHFGCYIRYTSETEMKIERYMRKKNKPKISKIQCKKGKKIHWQSHSGDKLKTKNTIFDCHG